MGVRSNLSNGQKLQKIYVHEKIVQKYNATASIVIGNLYFQISKFGESTSSLISQSIRTGVSKPTVRRWVNKFISDGLLSVREANTASGVVYVLGPNSDLNVIVSYKSLITKKAKPKNSGALVAIDTKSMIHSAGKKAEGMRLQAFLASYSVDRSASERISSKGKYAYFRVKSLSALARKFGIARQTLHKYLKIFKDTSMLEARRFDGSLYIDLLEGLASAVNIKHKILKQSFQ
jgi:transposase-like protein